MKRRPVCPPGVSNAPAADESAVRARHEDSGVRGKARVAATQPTTVLIVDDERRVRAAVRRVLRRSYTVIEAPDAMTGVSLCVKHRPAAVVSDYYMPGLNGKELAKLITLALGDQAPPVIIFTGSDRSLAECPEVALILGKPDDLTSLHDEVAALIPADEDGAEEDVI